MPRDISELLHCVCCTGDATSLCQRDIKCEDFSDKKVLVARNIEGTESHEYMTLQELIDISNVNTSAISICDKDIRCHTFDHDYVLTAKRDGEDEYFEMVPVGSLITPPPAGHTVHLYVHQDNDSSTPGWDVTHFASLRKAVGQARIEFQASKVIIHLMSGYVWSESIDINNWDASKIEILSDEEEMNIVGFTPQDSPITVSNILDAKTLNISSISAPPSVSISDYNNDGVGGVRLDLPWSDPNVRPTAFLQASSFFQIIGSVGTDPNHPFSPGDPQYVSSTQYTYDGYYMIDAGRRTLLRYNSSRVRTGPDPIFVGRCDETPSDSKGTYHLLNATMINLSEPHGIDGISDTMTISGSGSYNGDYLVWTTGNNTLVMNSPDSFILMVDYVSGQPSGTMKNKYVSRFVVPAGQPFFKGLIFYAYDAGSYNGLHVIKDLEEVGANVEIHVLFPYESGQHSGSSHVKLDNLVEVSFTDPHALNDSLGVVPEDFIAIVAGDYTGVHRVLQSTGTHSVLLDSKYKGVTWGTSPKAKKAVVSDVSGTILSVRNTYNGPTVNVTIRATDSQSTGISCASGSFLITAQNCGVVGARTNLSVSKNSILSINNANFNYSGSYGIDCSESTMNLSNVSVQYCRGGIRVVNTRGVFNVLNVSYSLGTGIQIRTCSLSINRLFAHNNSRLVVNAGSNSLIELKDFDIVNYHCDNHIGGQIISKCGIVLFGGTKLQMWLGTSIPCRIVRRIWLTSGEISGDGYNRSSTDLYIWPGTGCLVSGYRQNLNTQATVSDPGRASGGGSNLAFNTLTSAGISFSDGSHI